MWGANTVVNGISSVFVRSGAGESEERRAADYKSIV